MRFILALMLFSLSMAAHAEGLPAGCRGMSQVGEKENGKLYLWMYLPIANSLDDPFEIHDGVILDSGMDAFGCSTFVFNEPGSHENYIKFDAKKMQVTFNTFWIGEFTLGKVKDWRPGTTPLRLVVELPEGSVAKLKQLNGPEKLDRPDTYSEEMQVVIPGEGSSLREENYFRHKLNLTLSYDFLRIHNAPTGHWGPASYKQQRLLDLEFKNR